MKQADRSVFFCATHRSGSTFLTETIRKLDQIGRPAEAFYPQNIAEVLRRSGLEPTDDYRVWLPLLIEEGSSPTGWFAAKVFADNFRWLVPLYSGKAWPEGLESFGGFFEEHFPGARFISIRRRSRLKQAVSLLKALQSGLWHSTQKNKVKARRTYYDRGQIQWAIGNIDKQENDVDQVLSAIHAQRLNLYYEDYIQDMEGTLRTIFDFLEMSPGKLTVPSVDLKKLRNAQNAEWVERFEQESLDSEKRPQPLLGKEPAFKLRLLDFEEKVIPGSRMEAEFTIKNLTREEIRFVGNTSGEGKILLYINSFLTGSEEKPKIQNIPVPYSIGPGEEKRMLFHYEAPSEAGSYSLKFSGVQNGLGDLNVEGDPDFTVEVSDFIMSSLKKCFGHLEITPDNWCYSPWFGYFYPNTFPWILSVSHGWLQILDKPETEFTPEKRITISDFAMGEWSTSKADYPVIWKSDGSTLRYQATKGNDRVFTDGEGKEIAVPISKEAKA